MPLMKYFVVGLFCAVLVGCTQNVTREELVGIYSVQNREGEAVLTLQSDLRFSQVITFKDGKSQSASGFWKYDEKSHQLTLTDCFAVNENTLSWRVNASSIPVMKVLGKVELEADPDAGLRYVKLADKR